MILSYLGSKASLLKDIEPLLTNILTPKVVLCDLFSGSGSFAHHFKNKVAKVIGCDSEMFSYVLNKALLTCPFTLKLGHCINAINDIIQNTTESITIANNPKLIEKYFSIKHLFFKRENAKKIDLVRIMCSTLYKKHVINYSEFLFLLASLQKSASKIANTTGTFRAHLKHLSKKADKDFFLEPIHKNTTIHNASANRVFLEDSLKLSQRIKADVVYIDPPYNSVHYSAYYSFLNYLCFYNKSIKLVGPGIINNYFKSKFGLKKTAQNQMEQLFHNLCCSKNKKKYIIMSYNSTGIIPLFVLKNIMRNYGYVTVHKFPHKKYQSNKKATIKRNTVIEYVIILNVYNH